MPTLVLPPQAGHDSCIVDYSPEQSQMKVIRAAGLTRAYSADWKGATRETADTTVDDYLDFIEACIERIGGAREPHRRLSGRLAGHDLRGAAPRGRPHADDRGRPDRLPGRRRDHPRLRALVRPGARHGLLPLGRPARRRRPARRPHAQRLHPHQARERARQAHAAALEPPRRAPSRAPPPLRDLVQAHAGHLRRLLPVDRRAPVRAQLARRAASSRSAGGSSTSSRSGARSTCSPAPATTSRRPSRSSRSPTT